MASRDPWPRPHPHVQPLAPYPPSACRAALPHAHTSSSPLLSSPSVPQHRNYRDAPPGGELDTMERFWQQCIFNVLQCDSEVLYFQAITQNREPSTVPPGSISRISCSRRLMCPTSILLSNLSLRSLLGTLPPRLVNKA
uniref:Uncharacterized protein n=1 Tax=Zea mays TaxID=4577 RepID=A0A804RLD3_MAIZE